MTDFKKPPMPNFAVPRSKNWTFVGWIEDRPKQFEHEATFEELVALTLGRGGVREVDYYPEGAVCWLKK